LSAQDYISVRDWRRKPPLRQRVTKKARHLLVLDQMHALSVHARPEEHAGKGASANLPTGPISSAGLRMRAA
jgi:hypothetical protein